MLIDLPLEELVSKIKDYIKNINTSKGIIILVDMGSLEKIHEALEYLSDGVIGIINNITTQVALDTGFKIVQGMEVEEIIEKVTANNRFNYKIIHTHFVGGIVASMEELNAKDEIEPSAISSIKTALMGHPSGIGDSIFLGCI